MKLLSEHIDFKRLNYIDMFAFRTYIFILDSLGTRHPQASKKLAKYLEMEAADKKGIDKPNSAQAKLASVGLSIIQFLSVSLTSKFF